MLPFFLSLLCMASSLCEARADELQVASAAESLHLGEDPVWNALLHYANGRCFVEDPDFYLSGEDCSPAGEVRAILSVLMGGDAAAISDVACRFPARVLFLRDKLGSIGVSFPSVQCPEFLEYTSKAPADSISLVFASENITDPTSMMGHVFLKVSGESGGKDVEHAVSFFTRMPRYNIFALVADSLFLGMPSFFALLPYAEQVRGYQVVERRNIFEYSLKASPFQRELIHAHVWELKNNKSPYLFVGYNCATVVYFLVALVDPGLLDELGRWISPIDVVRKVSNKGLVSSRHFIPSVDWQVRFLGHSLGPITASEVLETLRQGNEQELKDLRVGEQAPMKIAFANAVVEREESEPNLIGGNSKDIETRLEALGLSDNGAEFQIENLKDPTSGPKSSRMTLGAVHFKGSPYAKIELLPTSHSLSDDNRRLYSESMLELAEISLLVNPEEDRGIIIQQANLYAFESLVPRDPYIGGKSSRLSVGVQQEWDATLSPFTAGHITGGWGRSIQLSEDAMIYGLLNGGINYGDGRWALSYFPEVGGILYEILSMKTLASYRLVCGEHGSDGCYQNVSATQAVLLSDSFSPYASFSSFWNRDTSAELYEVGLKLYF